MAAKLDRPALRTLCDAATPGPWRTPLGVGGNITSRLDGSICWVNHNQDDAFIAAARVALPAALDELEAKDALLGRCWEVIRAIGPCPECKEWATGGWVTHTDHCSIGRLLAALGGA